jgi:hypothetical protein
LQTDTTPLTDVCAGARGIAIMYKDEHEDAKQAVSDDGLWFEEQYIPGVT